MLILQQPLTVSVSVSWNAFLQIALLINSAMVALSNVFEDSDHL